MKKYLLLVIIFFLVLVIIAKPIQTNHNKKELKQEKRAVFLSYIELQEYIKNKNIKESKANIDKIIDNIVDFNFNMLILQVRSFSDAIYNSKIYPWSSCVSANEGENPGYDILQYFIDKAHSKSIEVHAWINPYRIRNTKDVTTISKKNKAYEWLNTSKVKICEKGIYYNPAESEVQTLIVDGIKELVNNYKIDGIHFDDYFYPDSNIDIENYYEYLKNHEHISLDQFHLLMVDNLVKTVHTITKEKNIIFSISPEGNIQNNYSSNFADVYEWAKSDAYVDYLIPQIYYGFFNESQPFYEVLNNWNDLVKKSNVKIIPALALYKTGNIDKYAKSGENEWLENDNIIMKQVLTSRNIKSYNGFAIFRYDYLFNTLNQTEVTMEEIKNLKKIINN